MKSFFNSRHSKWLACLSLFAVFLAFANGGARSFAQDDFKSTTVFLVRHCERADSPREDPPLTEAGVNRSQQLARVLGKAGIKAIYTSQFLRTKQSAEPLAKQLGITSTVVSLKLSPDNPRQVSTESIKEMKDLIYQRAGDNALVIGHGNSIPDLIKALGGDTVPLMDEKEFDDLFVVTIYANGKARVIQIKY